MSIKKLFGFKKRYTEDLEEVQCAKKIIEGCCDDKIVELARDWGGVDSLVNDALIEHFASSIKDIKDRLKKLEELNSCYQIKL